VGEQIDLTAFASRGIGVLSLLAMLITACAATSSQQSSGEFAIGEIYSATGAYSIYSAPAHDGLRLAVQQINAKGGFTVGNTTYHIKLIALDDRSDITTASADAIQLVRDNGVKVIFGLIGNLCVPVAQITQPAHVLEFTPAVACGSIAATPGNRELFTVLPNIPARGGALVKAIQSFTPQVKKVTIMWQQALTVGELTPFENSLKAAGIYQASVIYPDNTSDFAPILTRIAATQPDAIWATGGGGFDTIARQLEPSGLGPNVTFVGWGLLKENCSKVGSRPCIADSTGYDISDTSSPALKRFQTEYLKLIGQTTLPTGAAYAPYFYDPLYLLVKAMQSAGTVTDGPKIADAVRSVSVDGLGGTVKFEPNDDALIGRFPISYVNGSNVVTQYYQTT
jgi:branched-chain amino acid transport system substrate-binding protein